MLSHYLLSFSPVYPYLEEFVPYPLNPNLKHYSLHSQLCKDTLCLFSRGAHPPSVATEYHPVIKESKILLLTLLTLHYLPSGFACPCVNPVFFSGRVDESSTCRCQSTVGTCGLLRFNLACVLICARRRMCTRSPDVSPLAVNNILDSCYQSWEAGGSLHCQQGEVTNYFYVLAFFLRMRVVSLPVFRVSDFSFSAIGIPSSCCATLAAYLFLEELERNRSPPLKRQSNNFQVVSQQFYLNFAFVAEFQAVFWLKMET